MSAMEQFLERPLLAACCRSAAILMSCTQYARLRQSSASAKPNNRGARSSPVEFCYCLFADAATEWPTVNVESITCSAISGATRRGRVAGANLLHGRSPQRAAKPNTHCSQMLPAFGTEVPPPDAAFTAPDGLWSYRPVGQTLLAESPSLTFFRSGATRYRR